MTTRVIAALAFLSLASCQAYRVQKQLSDEPRMDVATLGRITAAAGENDPPVEKRFRNIQVLQGLPSSQLYPVMAMFANSLGVTCAHCHGEFFEEETRPEKQIARQMIQLTREINRAQFQGEPTVTCFTCHRGRDYPLSAPEIAHAGWQKMLAPKAPDAPLPEASAIRDRYAAAMPRAGAVSAGRGEVTFVGGLDERKQGTFTLANGKLEATVQLPPPVERALARWQFGAVDLGNAGEVVTANTLAASTDDGPPERFTFDPASGFVARVQTGTMTELGFVPEEIRFSDYRPVGGVPTPHLVEWARGDYLITFRFSEIAR